MSFLLLRQPARSNVLIRSTRHLRPGGSPTCGTAISDRSSFVLASRHQQHTSTRKMPENRAAWLVAHKQYPLVVKDAPYTEPGPDEVAIRVAYAAMNPGIFVCATQILFYTHETIVLQPTGRLSNGVIESLPFLWSSDRTSAAKSSRSARIFRT
jgi:hypothetical protein